MTPATPPADRAAHTTAGQQLASEWGRLSALMDEALDLPLAERAGWLARVELEHPALAPRLRQLLAAQADSAGAQWLEHGPVLNAPLHAADGLAPGARLGPYELMNPLGGGGMASVWLARRADGSLARPVALKIPLVRHGTLAERFARERDILARLEHPHIARLYDAGVADDGTPWLALEYVDGEPIDTWCDRQRLPLAARIALFQQVLEAVQYAHARLVIHRDLKPSNILVTVEGQVKLLDFGIAKLLGDGEQAHATELTQAAGRVLTPAYAAPEQLRGEPLTTATDVHALGVVLFRLLSGASPYRVALDTAAQVEQAIAGDERRRASSALTAEAAALRGGTVATLARALRGDLDTILAKALQPTPQRRYASASALADDLQRHAAGTPVSAQPDTLAYRTAKFVRRNRLLVGAVGAVLVSLVAGLAAALWQAQRAEHERALAVAARQRSDSVRFFLGDMLGDAARAGKNFSAADLLKNGERIARSEFADRPDNLADVLHFIAEYRFEVEGAQAALPLQQELLRLARDPDLKREAECGLALTEARLGQHLEQASATLRRVAEDPATRPMESANCWSYLSDVLRFRNDAPGALSAIEKAWERSRQAERASPQFEFLVLGRRALLLMNSARAAEADQVYQQADALVRRTGRGDGGGALALRANWALARLQLGDAAGAVERYQDVLAQSREREGDNGMPPVPLLNAAGAHLELGEHRQALALYDQAAEAGRRWHDDTFGASAACLGALALAREGDLAAAQARLARGLAQTLPATPNGRIAASNCTGAEAQVALAAGRAAPARQILDKLLASPTLRASPRAHLLQVRSQAALALGDLAAARADAEASLAQAQQLQGPLPQSFRTALAALALAEAQAAQGAAGEQAAAAESLKLALAQMPAAWGAGHPARRRAAALDERLRERAGTSGAPLSGGPARPSAPSR